MVLPLIYINPPIVVTKVANKKQSPYKGSWIFNKVQGHWNGKTVEIFHTPTATKDEIALVIWHEKAHAHFGHPDKFPNLMLELEAEINAWSWTFDNLPKEYRSKHVIQELIHAIEF